MIAAKNCKRKRFKCLNLFIALILIFKLKASNYKIMFENQDFVQNKTR